jgi:hypothetical protein
MSTPEGSAVRVRLTLRPAPGYRGDPWVRLRRWIKLGLRVFGWVVTEAVELPAAVAAPGELAPGGTRGQR